MTVATPQGMAQNPAYRPACGLLCNLTFALKLRSLDLVNSAVRIAGYEALTPTIYEQIESFQHDRTDEC